MPGVAEPAGAADLSHGADSATGGDDDEGPLPMEETAFLDADGGAATTDNRKRGKKAGVPNWAPMEAVACVWAQIAQCEEEQQQSFTKLQSGAMARYPGKAKDLHGKGKWNFRLTGGRTPAQSALIRAGPGVSQTAFGPRQRSSSRRSSTRLSQCGGRCNTSGIAAGTRVKR